MISNIVLFIIGLIFFVVSQAAKWQWYAETSSHKNYWTGIIIGLICMLSALLG